MMHDNEGDLGSLFRSILTSRVYEVVNETPLEKAHKLSERFGNEVLLKREDMHPVFSFKLRGAYNKIVSLPREATERGDFCGDDSRAGGSLPRFL